MREEAGRIEARLAGVRERIDRACERAGRDPASVRLVGVAKGHPAERVAEAAAAGLADVGENRAQELRDKYRQLGDVVRWHYVGSVQTNKIRYLDAVHLIHSVDRVKEAEALQARTVASGRRWDILVEVNVSGERAKQGIAPEELEGFLERTASLPLIRVEGLMIVAPEAKNPEDVRWVFAETRRLRDRIRDARGGLDELSMGMSDDFEVAVEEGSTIVRIGRAIFREE